MVNLSVSIAILVIGVILSLLAGDVTLILGVVVFLGIIASMFIRDKSN